MPLPTPPVVRQGKDVVLKIVADALSGDLFQRFKLNLPPIVAALPSEFPQLEVRTEKVDLVFLLADGSILHLEFQTQQRSSTLMRFARYNLAIADQHGRQVYTVVLYGAGIRSASKTLRLGSLTFRVQNILIGRENGDAVLRRLHAKAVRGEEFTPADRIDLIFSPLMRQRRVVAEVLLDAARLARNLPQDQQSLTIGALLGLAYNYVNESVVAAILEDLSMPNPLATYFDKQIAEHAQQLADLEQREQRLAELEQREQRLADLEQRAQRLADLEQREQRLAELEQRAQRLAELEQRAQRLAEDKAEEKRADVRAVLQARLGALPADIERRIAMAGVEDLNALLPRAAIADSFDEL